MYMQKDELTPMVQFNIILSALLERTEGLGAREKADCSLPSMYMHIYSYNACTGGTCTVHVYTISGVKCDICIYRETGGREGERVSERGGREEREIEREMHS